MITIDKKNAGHPLNICGGGINETRNFQKIVMK